VSLLGEVVAHLDAQRVSHALIGAAAMALHGASRATADVDLLTVDPRALAREMWKALEDDGVECAC
jgi:hypothetical protein